MPHFVYSFLSMGTCIASNLATVNNVGINTGVHISVLLVCSPFGYVHRSGMLGQIVNLFLSF